MMSFISKLATLFGKHFKSKHLVNIKDNETLVKIHIYLSTTYTHGYFSIRFCDILSFFNDSARMVKIWKARKIANLKSNSNVNVRLFGSFFFFRKNYLLSCATSVRPSVEIIYFCGISISNRPIDLKMSMNVRKGVGMPERRDFLKF